MAFKVKKLNQEGVLKTNDIEDLCRMITCDINRKQCMYRECNLCFDRKLETSEFEQGKHVSYWNWTNRLEEYLKNGNPMKVQKTVKDKLQSTLTQLVDDMENLLKKRFCRHLYNIGHHFRILRSLKENINEKTVIINVDFSENYSCKFSSEVQSLHFGGSRNQVTLHTGILYTATGAKTFCTISDDLCHNPAGIWAHLDPVLKEAKTKNPEIEEVHFISDGPTTQYRSKGNFYLFSQMIHSKYGFKHASWNLTEAADGVGGLLKRPADALVSKGKDIVNAKDMFLELGKMQMDIQLFFVESKEIDAVKKMLPCLKIIEGTMKLHQIFSHASSPNVIEIRLLSCFCKWPGRCDCFSPSKNETHIFPQVISQPQEAETHASLANASDATDIKVAVKGITASRENEYPNAGDTLAEPDNIGEWCLVEYDSQVYPGIIQDLDSDSVEVKVMHRIGVNRFIWPFMEDCIWYEWKNVVGIIPEPTPVTKRHLQIDLNIWNKVFINDSSVTDVFLKVF